MSYNSERRYKFRKFELGELSNIFRKISEYFGIDQEKNSISAHYLYDNGDTEKKSFKINEVGSIGKITKTPFSLVFGFHIDYKWHSVQVTRDEASLVFDLEMQNAEDTANIFSILENAFNFEVYVNEESEEKEKEIPQIETLITKTDAIEQEYLDKEKKLRCFISHRFNPKSKIIVLELTRFLELLGVEVITGIEYEPRSVSEKILARLEDSDFTIYLITNEGESTWIRDEMSVSIGKGYLIIPLVENGAEFDKGILGDWQFVPYETDHIGDTFISLIEAINYIRKKDSNIS